MGTPVRHPGTHRTRGCGHGWTGGSSSGGRGTRTCRNPGCSRADEVTSIEAAVSRPIFSIAIGSSRWTVAALTTPAVCAGMDGVDPGRQRPPRVAVHRPPGAPIHPRCCDRAATRRRRIVGHGRTPSSLLTAPSSVSATAIPSSPGDAICKATFSLSVAMTAYVSYERYPRSEISTPGLSIPLGSRRALARARISPNRRGLCFSYQGW